MKTDMAITLIGTGLSIALICFSIFTALGGLE